MSRVENFPKINKRASLFIRQVRVGPLEYHPLGFYSHTKVRLGISKKVLKVLVAHLTSKLKHLKVFAL